MDWVDHLILCHESISVNNLLFALVHFALTETHRHTRTRKPNRTKKKKSWCKYLVIGSSVDNSAKCGGTMANVGRAIAAAVGDRLSVD